MGIHQLSVHHDPQHDRLLLRVSTQEGEEFRFWLTRRMVSRLLPALEQSMQRLDATLPGVVVADAPARQMLSEFTHAQSVQQSDFKTPFSPQTTLPLGESPLLITDVQINVTVNHELTLMLQDQSLPVVRQCQVQLNSQLLHGWMHLMAQALHTADWGLGVRPLTPHATDTHTAATAVPVYRH